MTIYEFSARTITGETQSLADYRDQVCLIVNLASACGYTSQYQELEALYRRHRDAGFSVLGFPCNQFGRQEPGDEAAIREFCTSTYDITFPLFAKIDVNGPGAHPLYQHLTVRKPGSFGTRRIKWNFTKFLVGRDGVLRSRHAPALTPAQLEPDVVMLLRASG